jgi:hypothetical protein
MKVFTENETGERGLFFCNRVEEVQSIISKFHHRIVRVEQESPRNVPESTENSQDSVNTD